MYLQLLFIFDFSYGTDPYPTIVNGVTCSKNYLVFLACSFSIILDSDCNSNLNDVGVNCCKLMY